jgi:SAM-dependent methyltransferase
MTGNDSYYAESYYQARYNFRPTSMYWWSTRYYARLVTKHAARRGARLLEIGYGMGHLLGMLERDFDTTGVDVSAYANQEAPKNAPASQFISGDIAAGLDFPAGHFAVVVAKHIFEHVPQPDQALAECARLLEPGGLLLYGTPNPTSLGAGWKGERWVGWSDPSHVSVLPPAEWLRLTRAAGFIVKRAFGDGLWDVPYVRWLPTAVQRGLFGLPALAQVLTVGTWMPLKLGESLLVVAHAP